MRSRVIASLVVLVLALAGAVEAQSPKRVPKFKLKTLDGKEVALDSLEGKVVVINFWGIWCTLCLEEMPEVQKLHEKYAADPAVAVLTINTDPEPADVPPWMTQRGYTFPVLLDDGYVGKAGLTMLPTTWFLDGRGRKIAEKTGFTENLSEQFSARIEAIRAGTGTARRRER